MNMPKNRVVIFDFDGVIMDTETIYTKFWDEKGEEYLGLSNFGDTVKGMTDHVIYDKYFSKIPDLKPVLDKAISKLEADMPMNYIKGSKAFIEDLRANGIRIGMATSSDNKKMKMVFSKRPELSGLIDKCVTVNEVEHPKPHPESYIKAMKHFGVAPKDTVIFEDSISGLTAARDSGAIVVGVASTNTREQIAPYCDFIINDFSHMNYAKLQEFFV